MMKYFDGKEVKAGDAVTVEGQGRLDILAVVVRVLRPHTTDALDWNMSKGGVIIEGGGLGLFVNCHLEKDFEIKFVHTR
jgi:hypothetical protein